MMNGQMPPVPDGPIRTSRTVFLEFMDGDELEIRLESNEQLDVAPAGLLIRQVRGDGDSTHRLWPWQSIRKCEILQVPLLLGPTGLV